MCKKICLVKKDLLLPEAPDNWIIMNGFEFYIFIHSEEGQKRKKNFVSMPPFDYDDPEDIWYIIEYPGHKRKAVKKQANRAHYVKTQEFDFPIEILSYSHMNEDGLEDDYEALMVDPYCFVEEDALEKLQWAEVLLAIDKLNELDRSVIQDYFLGAAPMSLREYAKKHDVNTYIARKRKLSALQSLKQIIEIGFLNAETPPAPEADPVDLKTLYRKNKYNDQIGRRSIA